MYVCNDRCISNGSQRCYRRWGPRQHWSCVHVIMLRGDRTVTERGRPRVVYAYVRRACVYLFAVSRLGAQSYTSALRRSGGSVTWKVDCREWPPLAKQTRARPPAAVWWLNRTHRDRYKPGAWRLFGTVTVWAIARHGVATGRSYFCWLVHAGVWLRIAQYNLNSMKAVSCRGSSRGCWCVGRLSRSDCHALTWLVGSRSDAV